MPAPPSPARPDRDPPVDPRGVRFSAAVTTAVLALVLLSGSTLLLAVQAAVFGLAAVAGLRFAPYAVLYRLAVAPRLGPPAVREPAAPVRFSQAVGLVFTAVGVAAHLAGLPVVGLVATAAALVAALLNAAVGFCLGCELHGLLVRLTRRPTSPATDRQGATA